MKIHLQRNQLSKLTIKGGRCFAHFTAWECHLAGYWNDKGCDHSDHWKSKALLEDCTAFWNAMETLVCDWPISSAVHLSDSSINRKAWLGQASCFVSTGNCQQCTKRSWAHMTIDKQLKANETAQRMINKWVTENDSSQKPSTQLVFRF